MELAKDYQEHMKTGQPNQEDIPIHLQNNFAIAHQLIHNTLTKKLCLRQTTPKDWTKDRYPYNNHPTYLKIMTTIFNTGNYHKMLSNLWHYMWTNPLLFYDLDQRFSYRLVANESNPFGVGVCPLCGQRENKLVKKVMKI